MVWETLSNDLIAIDYNREQLPLSEKDILVPQYVQKDEMIQCNDGQHVALVNSTRGTLDVFYFKNDGARNQLRKSSYPKDNVPLESVLSICRGVLNPAKNKFVLY